MFSVVEAVLLEPLPYAEPDRLVQISETVPLRGAGPIDPDDVEYREGVRRHFAIAPANFVDWRERNESLSGIAAVADYPTPDVNLAGGTEPVRVRARRVSGNFFDVLGVGAALGRTLLPEDDAPGAEPVVVLSHGLWTRAFGADPGALGASVRVDDRPHTVVGVMPPDFAYLQSDGGSPGLWMPGAVTPSARDNRSARTLRAVARLGAGVSLGRAQSEMDRIALALADEHPEDNRTSTGAAWGIHLQPMRDFLIEDRVRSSLLVLVGAVGLVLLISWVNVTNLLVARRSARRRELAVRTAIGAGRWRVGRQLVTKALVLSCLGGIGGIALAKWAIAMLVSAAPPPAGGAMGLSSGAIPLLSRATIGSWVVLMTSLTCLVTSVVCGLAPAIRATRRDVHVDLKAGGHRSGGRGTAAGLLVAVEIGLSVILVIGVGLLVGTMQTLAAIPVGFEAHDAQVMRVPLTRERYATLAAGEPGQSSARWSLNPEHGALARDVVDRLEALPDVEAAGAVNILPIQDAVRSNDAAFLMFDWLDRTPMTSPVIDGVHPEGFSFVASATSGYFRAMGIPLLEGRAFTDTDDDAAPLVAIVNPDLVDWFDLGHPVGKTLRVAAGGPGWRTVEIVGVVGGVLQLGYYPATLALGRRMGVLYLPYAQPAVAFSRFRIDFHMTTNFVVRHHGDSGSMGAAMENVVRSVAPDLPVAFNAPLEEYLSENLVDRRFQLLLIGVLAGVALVMALVGVYGVMAFRVGRRLHEIGVRLALGATSSGVVGMIVGDGARVALLGVLLGIAGAMGATRLLSPWLYGVSPTDPTIFAGLSLAMVAIAVLACWIPARRATRVDPVETLRTE